MSYSVKPLAKEMENFGYRNGIGMAETLSALLDYIICYFDPNGKPVEGWRYNKEQNQCFLLHDVNVLPYHAGSPRS